MWSRASAIRSARIVAFSTGQIWSSSPWMTSAGAVMCGTAVEPSWVALAPERYPAESTYGTYEVWADQHGGALCEYLAPGERGSRDRSFRGVHHNAACKSWRATTVGALVREARAAVPVMGEGELLVLGHQLQELQKAISSQIRESALRGED